MPDSEYDIAYNNLRDEYNTRAYIAKFIKLYDMINKKIPDSKAGDFYRERAERGLLFVLTATRQAIMEFDDVARPLYHKYFRKLRRKRAIDFNQGIDARLVTDENMAILSETAIDPLRIAFDHYEQRDIYIKAVKMAAQNGIRHLSNYLLYNFKDKPEELYYRMKINIDLCEEEDVTIYSFPMKYHPIRDPEYFRNRNYIGEHWNRKFIRAVQAVLNATKGKIGRGKEFFEEAFGKDLKDFFDILWMPETFIINRMQYKDNLTKEWRQKFYALSEYDSEVAKEIIAANDFSDEIMTAVKNPFITEVLAYYQIRR